jgi:hypothetical protein
MYRLDTSHCVYKCLVTDSCASHRVALSALALASWHVSAYVNLIHSSPRWVCNTCIQQLQRFDYNASAALQCALSVQITISLLQQPAGARRAMLQYVTARNAALLHDRQQKFSIGRVHLRTRHAATRALVPAC